MPTTGAIRRINGLSRYPGIVLLLCAFSKPTTVESSTHAPSTQALLTADSLASLNSSLQIVNPKNNFHREVRNKLLTLSATSSFFKQALDAVDKKGYEFVLYDENDSDIPQRVHDVMSEEGCDAITFKNIKKVHIKQDGLNTHAAETGTSPETQFLAMLANEATHIILDDIPKEDSDFGSRLTEEETKDEVKAMKDSKEYTELEIDFHKILNEEILSQVVEDIIVKQQDNPNFKLKKKELFSQDTYRMRLIQIKFGIATPVFERIFNIDSLSDLSEEDGDFVLDRVHKYLFSGDIENYLAIKLKDFGLLGEEKN